MVAERPPEMGLTGTDGARFRFFFEVMLTECAVFRIQKEKTCRLHQ
jgi:hypothetical protein